MSFDQQQICNGTFIEAIDFHDQLESTNSHAVSLIQQGQFGAGDGPRLVLAERQTAGRGRGANRWWSEEGSLTFSLILTAPKTSPQSLPLISLVAGLGVCESVERFAPRADLALKWPNDVYAEGCKLAGILIERPAGSALVVGIGVNVNNRRDTAPEEVRQLSTSVRELTGDAVDRDALLIQILQQLEARFDQLRKAPQSVLDDWRRYDYLLGKSIELDAYGEVFRGDYLGVGDDGTLRLATQEGEREFSGGKVLLKAEGGGQKAEGRRQKAE